MCCANSLAEGGARRHDLDRHRAVQGSEDALEGSYGGVTAGATAAVGGSLNVLIGGLDTSISLQPISDEGNNGLSITAAVGLWPPLDYAASLSPRMPTRISAAEATRSGDIASPMTATPSTNAPTAPIPVQMV